MKTEITRENITNADLEFINKIIDESTYLDDLTEVSDTLTETMRNCFTLSQVLEELNRLRENYEKDKDYYHLFEILRIIKYNNHHELSSTYINDTMFRTQEVVKILTTMSKYFLQKKIENKLNREKETA